VEEKGWKGSVVKTVSTTMAVDRLASRYGLPLYETPVGFNYIAEHMLNGDVLMGGEESGGMSVKGHIPEGDGILMGLLLLEAMAASSMPLKALVEDLASDVGPLFYARRDINLDKPRPKKALVEALLASAPSRIAGIEVGKVSDLDGVKYFLGEEGWLLIRPSGTEPLLRVYAEATAQTLVEAFLKEGEKLGLQALENLPH
jgi:phosphomannomutase